MTLIEQLDNLRVHIHSLNHELAALERDAIESGLRRLQGHFEAFEPVDLHLQIIRHLHKKKFHVTASLHLAEKNFFTGARAVDLLEALDSCLDKLVGKLDDSRRALGAR